MTAEVLNNNVVVEEQSKTSPVSLDEFLRTIQKPAYRMAQLSTHNTEEALDIVQDAIVKLLQNYRHKPVSELKPLFYSILSSKLTDWHRKKQFRSKFDWLFTHQEDEANPLENLASEFAMSHEELITNEREMVYLVSALSDLTERQRQVVLLRHWHGFSVLETADILKCSAGSVKTHLHRATQSLRQRQIELENES